MRAVRSNVLEWMPPSVELLRGGGSPPAVQNQIAFWGALPRTHVPGTTRSVLVGVRLADARASHIGEPSIMEEESHSKVLEQP